jgi:hypothetical protein
MREEKLEKMRRQKIDNTSSKKTDREANKHLLKMKKKIQITMENDMKHYLLTYLVADMQQ